MVPLPHRASRVRAGLDQSGELNQSGPWMPSRPRIRFTGPELGLNMQTKATVAATGGASAGR